MAVGPQDSGDKASETAAVPMGMVVTFKDSVTAVL
jgi:hypothetical protein